MTGSFVWQPRRTRTYWPFVRNFPAEAHALLKNRLPSPFLYEATESAQATKKEKKNNLNLWPLAQPAFIKCIQQIFIVYTTLPFIHFWEDTGSCTVPRYSAKNTCALKTSCFCIYLAPMWIHYLSSYSKLQFTYFLKKCNIKAMKNCTYCGWRG